MRISATIWFFREMNTFKKIHIEKTTVAPTLILVGRKQRKGGPANKFEHLVQYYVTMNYGLNLFLC